MANILLTDRCNQRCPYCFASEVMKEGNPNISVPDLRRIVDFVVKTDRTFGLIGGEPLLHPEIDEILKSVIDDSRIKSVMLFTNGTEIREHIRLLTHPKIELLVNVNSEKDVGERNYSRTMENVRMMFDDYRMGYKITLGLNIYDPDQDLDYFTDLAKEMGVNHVRVSITVPDEIRTGFEGYFVPFIPLIKRFLRTMNANGISSSFDCNLMPICLMDEELKRLFSDSERLLPQGRHYVSGDRRSRCRPIVDIDQNGKAIRCFGMSDGPSYSIWDYEDLDEIRSCMNHDIDAKVSDMAEGRCADCHDNRCQKCYGGCIAFRWHQARPIWPS